MGREEKTDILVESKRRNKKQLKFFMMMVKYTRKYFVISIVSHGDCLRSNCDYIWKSVNGKNKVRFFFLPLVRILYEYFLGRWDPVEGKGRGIKYFFFFCLFAQKIRFIIKSYPVGY